MRQWGLTPHRMAQLPEGERATVGRGHGRGHGRGTGAGRPSAPYRDSMLAASRPTSAEATHTMPRISSASSSSMTSVSRMRARMPWKTESAVSTLRCRA